MPRNYPDPSMNMGIPSSTQGYRLDVGKINFDVYMQFKDNM